MDYDKASEYCIEILEHLLPVQPGVVININIPLLSAGEPKGIKVVPQSNEGFDEYYVPQMNEHGQTVFQLAGGPDLSDGSATDAAALIEGYISVTALAPDMTDYKATRTLRRKIGRLQLAAEL